MTTNRPARYKAVLGDRDVYLLALIRYIHLKPVPADMVTDPLDYPLSSHAAYAASKAAFKKPSTGT